MWYNASNLKTACCAFAVAAKVEHQRKAQGIGKRILYGTATT
jgi:hypothetical protein